MLQRRVTFRERKALDHIATRYHVPAKRGQRVRVLHEGEWKEGRISGAVDDWLTVVWDGKLRPVRCHPAHNIEYLPDNLEAVAMNVAYRAVRQLCTNQTIWFAVEIMGLQEVQKRVAEVVRKELEASGVR